MLSKDFRRRFTARKVFRGSQAILGERQHLLAVLRSVQKARIPEGRKQAEKKALSSLIEARTNELNHINPGWDKKFKLAVNPKTSAKQLIRLAANLPKDDYLLARLLTEHANASTELLQIFARHPYPAVRENVARHPNTPADLLRKLAEDDSEPLWFLVACNPSTPSDLRERLRARMKEMAPED